MAAGRSIAKLPSPRLQLRWETCDDPGDFDFKWRCHYELVLPLRKHDIRREIYNEDGEQVGERLELVVPLKGATRRGGGHEPCVNSETGDLYFDPPFRDAAHAKWDSAALGGLPVFVIALDGTPIPSTTITKAA